MTNQDWMRFAHTGRVADYLAYSQAEAASEAGHMRAGTNREQTESEARDGADHCAYRYGAGSHTHWGL